MAAIFDGRAWASPGLAIKNDRIYSINIESSALSEWQPCRATVLSWRWTGSRKPDNRHRGMTMPTDKPRALCSFDFLGYEPVMSTVLFSISALHCHVKNHSPATA